MKVITTKTMFLFSGLQFTDCLLVDMVLKLLSLLFLISHHHIVLVSCLNDEGLALLSFKQTATGNSSSSSLANWSSSDMNPCSWSGVGCSNDKVVSLILPSNGLAGFLHLDVTKLAFLRFVNLRNNYFSGSLPVELFSLTGLKTLVLAGNSFSGPVPAEIGNPQHLQSLDLSQNALNGSIPPTLLQCKRLRTLVLSENSLTGSLPDGLGTSLVMLQKLNLSFNNLSSLIPSDIGNLSSMQGVLDLSHNHFNGPIPASLGSLPETVYINLAYNNLSGLIPQNGALADAGPTAFLGNPLLCGLPLKNECPSITSDLSPKPIAEKPSQNSAKSSSRRQKGIFWRPCVLVAAVCSTVVVIIGLLFFYWYKKIYGPRRSKNKKGCSFEEKSVIRKDMLCFRTDDLESLSENMEQYTFVPVDSQVDFDLEQLLKASAFLLGKSRLGILYKVVLEKGLAVAVRRLENGDAQSFREFQAEAEAIGKIRHPNIVSLRAYCWCLNEKLLIYDYIPNGDLATAIHGRAGLMYFKPLSWSVRLRIMKGLAKGLVFLHELSPKRYVHGNLKPTNVLLGENMEPCISDFGLSRLACTTEEFITVQLEQMAGETSQQSSPFQQISPHALTPTKSRTYYEAPEASKARKPSQKWDVYSYGVILLEMISGKSPVMQVGLTEIDLVQWFQLNTEVKPLSDILDPFLAHDMDKEEEMVAVLKIALNCVNATPEKRPAMRNVSSALGRLNSSISPLKQQSNI